MNNLSRQERQYLIESHIPFVVEDRQIFLPFLGVALQERFDTEAKPLEKLQLSSQVLLLYFIYQNQRSIYTNDAVKVLGFSAMTITRAARQLEMTGIFRMKKEGIQKVLIADLTVFVLATRKLRISIYAGTVFTQSGCGLAPKRGCF